LRDVRERLDDASIAEQQQNREQAAAAEREIAERARADAQAMLEALERREQAASRVDSVFAELTAALAEHDGAMKEALLLFGGWARDRTNSSERAGETMGGFDNALGHNSVPIWLLAAGYRAGMIDHTAVGPYGRTFEGVSFSELVKGCNSRAVAQAVSILPEIRELR
jgi:hypothetical protein